MENVTKTLMIVDNTSQQVFSGKTIVAGATGGIPAGTDEVDYASVISKKIGQEVIVQPALQVLNQATGGMATPIYRGVKTLATQGLTAGVATAGVMLAIKGIEFAVSKYEERIAKLESEASAANEKDNLLIKAGSLNISGATITTGKYGRDVYTYGRS